MLVEVIKSMFYTPSFSFSLSCLFLFSVHLVFTGVVFFGLTFLFYLRGDKIPKVIEEMSDVKDVRSATVIDLVYTLILIVFQWMSTVPMSTGYLLAYWVGVSWACA
jgi:hypothetical protein